MAAKSAAQEEFDDLVAKNAGPGKSNAHPEDRLERSGKSDVYDDRDEEARYRDEQVENTMRMPVFEPSSNYILPSSGVMYEGATGVKGVIADARSFDAHKRTASLGGKRMTRDAGRINGSSRGMSGQGKALLRGSEGESDEDLVADEFLEEWRDARKRELQKGSDIRTRRTSPSMRRYGRFDEVDALGYLDAIEKVGRETIVAVFVYDHEVRIPPSLLHPLVGGSADIAAVRGQPSH